MNSNLKNAETLIKLDKPALLEYINYLHLELMKVKLSNDNPIEKGMGDLMKTAEQFKQYTKKKK